MRIFNLMRVFDALRQPRLRADEGTDVDDELMFHFRSLVEENLARGMTQDAAWAEAQARFGTLGAPAIECRRLRRAPHVRSYALAALLFGVALFAVWRMTSVPAPLLNDVSGQVVDRNNRPLAGARLLVIIKTWPGGFYRQEAFSAVSDTLGRFRLPELVPVDGQFAVQVAAVKDGYALTSIYQLQEEGRHLALEPITLRCDDASRVTLVIQDANGQPLSGVRVAASSRHSPRGETHVVYFQACQPIQIDTDLQGQVALGCFERGDEAEIYVRARGRDWELHTVNIPRDQDVVVLSITGSSEDQGGVRPENRRDGDVVPDVLPTTPERAPS